jgi:hypothetical protein
MGLAEMTLQSCARTIVLGSAIWLRASFPIGEKVTEISSLTVNCSREIRLLVDELPMAFSDPGVQSTLS